MTMLSAIANSGQIWAMQTSTTGSVIGEMEYDIRQVGTRKEETPEGYIKE